VSDIGLEHSPVELALIVLIFALPWMLGGAVIGVLLWRVVARKRWWIGALAGAGLGAVTGFFGMMP
jgi:hypothetical protein